MELAELMVGVSHWAWQFLDAAQRSGFSPREETITEQLLVEIAEKAPGQVHIHKSTSAEEADTGVDFALAIQVRSGLWLSLLFQAKKLDHRSGTYTELKKSTAFTQIQHLMASARSSYVLPMYLLFNGSTIGADGSQVHLDGCSLRRLRRGPHGPAWRGESPIGCTIIAAKEVKKLLDSGEAHDPARMSFDWAPWECLLCPFLGGAGRPRVVPWPPHTPSQGLIAHNFDVIWLADTPRPWLAALLEGANPENAENAPPARYFVALKNPEQTGNSADR